MDNDHIINFLKTTKLPNGETLNSIRQPAFSNVNETHKAFRSSLKAIDINMEKKEAKEAEYREAVVSALQGIEKNTALLTEMNVLMQKNADKQDQVFELMTEILAIMKASNKEEAENNFMKVMEKIGVVAAGINGASSLYNMANTVYMNYLSLFPTQPPIV